jgi:hypothetical protein
MTKEETHYLSYLLRLWRDSDVENVWRASIESPHTGQCQGFAGLDELFAFLQQQTSIPPDEVETRLCTEQQDDELTTARLGQLGDIASGLGHPIAEEVIRV